MTDREFKKRLHDHCVNLIAERISAIEDEMRSLQSAANEEIKSSAGDKYETGRAMLMLEKERLANQREEAFKTQKVLSEIDPHKKLIKGELGALVRTSRVTYFLSAGIGKIEVEGQTVFAVSLASPIGNVLEKKCSGDEVIFRGQKTKVIEVS